MITSLPNLLTLSRILMIPAVIGAFYLPGDWGHWVPLALFISAGVTDWLDGYLARVRAEVSPLGRFLDPLADKLLVASTLLMLVALDRITGWTILPTIVILCREIMVSGLREFLAEVKVRVPVSRLAKWKTTVQLFAIGFLIVGEAGWHVLRVTEVGILGLWLAAILTIYTGYDYMRAGVQHMTPGAAPGTRARGPRGMKLGGSAR